MLDPAESAVMGGRNLEEFREEGVRKPGGVEAGGARGVQRFVVLDAMRGLAAVAVMMLHLPELFGGALFPHGHLAVDFFFMLSGFVMSFAYQAKLDGGMPASRFLTIRLIRLYPLYLLGLLLGFARAFAWQPFDSRVSRPDSLLYLVMGLLMLPAWPLSGLPWCMSTPFNPPEWSIVFEFFANICHAFGLRRRSWKILAGLVVLSAALLAWTAVREGTLNIGWQSTHVLAGIWRVLFPYFVGIALYRVWRLDGRRLAIPAFIPVVILLLVFSLPQPKSMFVGEDLLIVGVLFPAILLMGAYPGAMKQVAGPFESLGEASYAIYVLHIPLAGLFSQIWKRVLGHTATSYAPWSGICFAVLMLFGSLGIVRLYDTPVRAWLRKRLVPVKPTLHRTEAELG